jgi:curved DNA-binding protein CbpA
MHMHMHMHSISIPISIMHMHMHMHMQVTKAFRQQSLLVHPDKNSAAEAEEAFKRVHAAYIALKEEVAQGRGQPPRPAPSRSAHAPPPSRAAPPAPGTRAGYERPYERTYEPPRQAYRSYEPPRGRGQPSQPFNSESFHWG